MDDKLKCLLRRMDSYLGGKASKHRQVEEEDDVRRFNPFFSSNDIILAKLRAAFPTANSISHIDPQDNDTIYKCGGYAVDSVFIWNTLDIYMAIMNFTDAKTNLYRTRDHQDDLLDGLIARIKRIPP
jgi:hypothetical protein